MSEFLSNQLILAIFAVGYLAIIFEFHLKVNKTSVALVMAVICWALYFVASKETPADSIDSLNHHLADIAQVILFLLGAMTLVELIDSHKGFSLITECITTRSKKMMILLIGTVTFFLSAVLDNLTTTILMISILKKLIPDPKDRIKLACLIVIAANAGGAWTPIGDVTTTMLWINDKITTSEVMQLLLLPSIVACLVPMIWYGFQSEGSLTLATAKEHRAQEPHAQLVLILGIMALVFVPVIKYFTGLPPFMGILISLGVLWLVTDFLHHGDNTRHHLRVPYILTKIDTANILFFLGILLAVDALQAVQLLDRFALLLNNTIGSVEGIAAFIGIISAVIDNVPLVAAAIGMYDVATFPIDHPFWLLLAYAAGTGGSLLIIGSSSGVAVMGMEKIDFFTYFKKAFTPALLGYLAGLLLLIALLAKNSSVV